VARRFNLDVVAVEYADAKIQRVDRVTGKGETAAVFGDPVALKGQAAPADAQFIGQVVGGDHHAGLDQHLLHRNVQRANNFADILQLALGILDDKRIGALIHGDGT